MGQNFDDYPGFQPFRSWANTYAQDCNQVAVACLCPMFGFSFAPSDSNTDWVAKFS